MQLGNESCEKLSTRYVIMRAAWLGPLALPLCLVFKDICLGRATMVAVSLLWGSFVPYEWEWV